MLPPEAVYRFADRQKWLLRHTYDQSWQRGVASYEPDPDPAQEPSLPRSLAITGLTGAALLAVYRRYAYVPPQSPDPVTRAVALAPSFQGINRMASELASPVTLAALGTGSDVAGWAETNAWRLDAGASVAWAGEQAGFAEAANADGQMLYQWMSAGDNRVCDDCEMLSSFPPMALGDWPTSPGAGDTTCNVGCRCSWDIFGQQLPDNYTPSLSPEQQGLIDTISERQLQALQDMMPDAAYLE